MKLSFLCPSYNHASEIGTFLDSLAAQTDPDWEAIIVDDASTDGTAGQVKRFEDSRVRLIRHGFNRGMTAGLNDAFDASSGELVTFFGTDDVLKSDFVAEMKSMFRTESDLGAIYTPLATIDANGSSTGEIIPLPELSKDALFSELFCNWNCLPSPGMTMRRDVMARMSPLPEGLIMYTDYLMHLEIVAHCRVAFQPKPLVLYRTSAKGKGAGISMESNVTDMRSSLELDTLMNRACDIVKEDLCLFNRLFVPIGVEAKSIEEIPYLLGKVLLKSPMLEKRKWGVRKIMELLSERNLAERLHSRFGVTYADYLKLSSDVAVSDKLQTKYRRLRRRCRILYILLAAFFTISVVLLVLCMLKFRGVA